MKIILFFFLYYLIPLQLMATTDSPLILEITYNHPIINTFFINNNGDDIKINRTYYDYAQVVLYDNKMSKLYNYPNELGLVLDTEKYFILPAESILIKKNRIESISCDYQDAYYAQAMYYDPITQQVISSKIIKLFDNKSIFEQFKEAIFQYDFAKADTYLSHIDINKPLDDEGRNLLHVCGMGSFFAPDSDFTSIVDYLIKNGAEIDAQDKFGLTPLCYAMSGSNLNLVKKLLEYNAKIEYIRKRDSKKISVLFFVSEKTTQPMVKCIIERGADLSLSSADGENTIIDILKKYNLK